MRIDQTGVSANIQAPAVQQRSTTAGRTDSPAPVQQVREATRQKPSIKQKQDLKQVEAEISAEKRSVENEQVVIKAIEKANKQFKTFDRRLEFTIHDTTKQIMVKVINTSDDTVIREIPSEKVLDMVAHMWEIAGILVDEKR